MTSEDFWANRTPRQVATDTISTAVHDAASAELGEARLEDDPESYARERKDPDRLRRHSLRCVEVAHELRVELDGWIANARGTGSTWQEIADAIGTTRQGAHRRYAKVDETAQRLRSDLTSVAATPAPDDGWTPSSTWSCTQRTCTGEHPYASWDQAQTAMQQHVVDVAHSRQWPVTFRLTDPGNTQPGVYYLDAIRTDDLDPDLDPGPGPEPDRDLHDFQDFQDFHDPVDLGGYFECRNCGAGWDQTESAPVRCALSVRIGDGG